MTLMLLMLLLLLRSNSTTLQSRLLSGRIHRLTYCSTGAVEPISRVYR